MFIDCLSRAVVFFVVCLILFIFHCFIKKIIVKVKNHTKKYDLDIKALLLKYLLAYSVMLVISFTLLPLFQYVTEDAIPAINIIPFRFLYDYFLGAKKIGFFLGTKYFLINTVGNIALFIPFGFFISVLTKKNLFRVFIFSFSLSLLIEILQFIQMYFHIVELRTTDIDDVILNTIGGVLGLVLNHYLVKVNRT